MFFDSPKDLVFRKILVFTNIFSFPGVNWSPKFTFDFTFDILGVSHWSQSGNF